MIAADRCIREQLDKHNMRAGRHDQHALLQSTRSRDSPRWFLNATEFGHFDYCNLLFQAGGQTAAQQRSPTVGAVNQCLASVVTALNVIGNPRSEGEISIDKFTPQQQRTYEELQELADVLRTETSGTEKKPSVVNVVKDLMAYRRCIVEGGESASPSVGTTPAMAPFTPADCSEQPEKTSGVYTIYPSGAAVQVYCDQTTDGGGWTVFLRRQKQEPQLNFSRTFKEYEEGFGSPTLLK
ncbi:tenascin-like, partial [Hyalella azteca]|uniref:Tenascin-like n=1 Tax=Hyalella azteca TaxID=294128 RepID=A0A8B7PLR0_HYAAZ